MASASISTLPTKHAASVADRINAALTGTTPASADIAALIADARTEKLRQEQHAEAMEASALDPRKTSSEATQMRDEAARLTFEGRRITAGIEHLDELFKRVSTDEKRIERESVYWQVRRERDAVAKEAEKRLGPLCDELLALVSRIREIDGRIFRGNDGVPAGEAPIADLVKPTSIRPGEQPLVADEFDFFSKGLAAMRDKFEGASQ